MYIIKLKRQQYILDEDFWNSDEKVDFVHTQLLFCKKIGDYETLERRINKLLREGGIKIYIPKK